MSEPSVHQIALPTTIATSPPTTPTPAPSSPSPWSASVQQTLPGSPISPLTPPEKPVLTLPSSDIQPQAASASASNLLESSTVSISADYIVGINDIDLGPRINDLSKMWCNIQSLPGQLVSYHCSGLLLTNHCIYRLKLFPHQLTSRHWGEGGEKPLNINYDKNKPSFCSGSCDEIHATTK